MADDGQQWHVRNPTVHKKQQGTWSGTWKRSTRKIQTGLLKEVADILKTEIEESKVKDVAPNWNKRVKKAITDQVWKK